MSLLSDFPLSTFLKIPSFWLDKGEGRAGACEQKFKWLQAHFYFILFDVFFLLCVFLPVGGGVPVVGRMVQLVLLLQELWWRSEESGETLSYPEVAWRRSYRAALRYL